MNLSGKRCYEAILGLCGPDLDDSVSKDNIPFEPINESPQTQMNKVYSMMWPNVPMPEADIMMRDVASMEFLQSENQNFDLGA